MVQRDVSDSPEEAGDHGEGTHGSADAMESESQVSEEATHSEETGADRTDAGDSKTDTRPDDSQPSDLGDGEQSPQPGAESAASEPEAGDSRPEGESPTSGLPEGPDAASSDLGIQESRGEDLHPTTDLYAGLESAEAFQELIQVGPPYFSEETTLSLGEFNEAIQSGIQVRSGGFPQLETADPQEIDNIKREAAGQYEVEVSLPGETPGGAFMPYSSEEITVQLESGFELQKSMAGPGGTEISGYSFLKAEGGNVSFETTILGVHGVYSTDRASFSAKVGASMKKESGLREDLESRRVGP